MRTAGEPEPKPHRMRECFEALLHPGRVKPGWKLVAIGGFFRDGGAAALVDNFLTCRRSGVVQAASGPGIVFMRLGAGRL